MHPCHSILFPITLVGGRASRVTFPSKFVKEIKVFRSRSFSHHYRPRNCHIQIETCAAARPRLAPSTSNVSDLSALESLAGDKNEKNAECGINEQGNGKHH